MSDIPSQTKLVRLLNQNGFCACALFDLWYVGDDGARWCACAHEDRDHLDNYRSCVGEVVVLNV